MLVLQVNDQCVEIYCKQILISFLDLNIHDIEITSRRVIMNILIFFFLLPLASIPLFPLTPTTPCKDGLCVRLRLLLKVNLDEVDKAGL